jgi:hypothetical protein
MLGARYYERDPLRGTAVLGRTYSSSPAVGETTLTGVTSGDQRGCFLYCSGGELAGVERVANCSSALIGFGVDTDLAGDMEGHVGQRRAVKFCFCSSLSGLVPFATRTGTRTV